MFKNGLEMFKIALIFTKMMTKIKLCYTKMLVKSEKQFRLVHSFTAKTKLEKDEIKHNFLLKLKIK